MTAYASMLYSRMVHQSTTLLHQCRQSALPVGCPLPMDPWWELYLCLVISKIGSTCSSQAQPLMPQRLDDSRFHMGHPRGPLTPTVNKCHHCWHCLVRLYDGWRVILP